MKVDLSIRLLSFALRLHVCVCVGCLPDQFNQFTPGSSVQMSSRSATLGLPVAVRERRRPPVLTCAGPAESVDLIPHANVNNRRRLVKAPLVASGELCERRRHTNRRHLGLLGPSCLAVTSSECWLSCDRLERCCRSQRHDRQVLLIVIIIIIIIIFIISIDNRPPSSSHFCKGGTIAFMVIVMALLLLMMLVVVMVVKNCHD